MEAHCERYNLTALDDLYAVTTYFMNPVNQSLIYKRPADIVKQLPEPYLDALEYGSCVKDMQKTKDGFDFNWKHFISCEGLVHEWAHDDYNDYVCRNYPDSHPTMCGARQRSPETDEKILI